MCSVCQCGTEKRTRERKRGKNTPRNNHSQFGGMNELWNRFFSRFVCDFNHTKLLLWVTEKWSRCDGFRMKRKRTEWQREWIKERKEMKQSIQQEIKIYVLFLCVVAPKEHVSSAANFASHNVLECACVCTSITLTIFNQIIITYCGAQQLKRMWIRNGRRWRRRRAK